MKSDPKALILQFYNVVWNEADEDAAYPILDEDFRFRGSLGPVMRGIDDFITYMRSVHKALGNYQCVIDDLITTETRVAARMTFKGVHLGALFGVPGTGKEISWAGAAFFTIRDERITTLWVLGDIDNLKLQLGSSSSNQFD